MVVVLLATSLLGAASAWMHGDGLGTILWWPGTALLASAAWSVGSGLRHAAPFLPGWGFGGATGLVAIASLGRWALGLLPVPGAPPPVDRVTLLALNPNLLGATLVVLATGTLLTVERRAVRWSLVVASGVAVVLTGSRTATFALLGVLAVQGLVRRVPNAQGRRISRRRFVASAGILIVLLALQVPPTNLLVDPHTFDAPAWRVLAERVDVRARTLEGPSGARNATRIYVDPDTEGRYPTILLTQSIGPGRNGVPYVASLYVRGEPGTPFALGNGLDVSACRVRTSWSRCVTPVSIGNGVRSMQLQMRTTDPTRAFELDVWGAQLEIGDQATPFDATTNLVSPLQAHRFRILDWRNTSSLRARLDTIVDASRWWADTPWIGVGRDEARTRFADAAQDATAPRHAHNAVVQVGLEAGVLGLVALLTPWAVALRFVRWRAFLAIAVSLIILNATDFTYYFGPVLVGAWFLLGFHRRTVRDQAE